MLLKDLYYYLIIAKSGFFNREFYLLTYPDVREADVDPLWHFIQIGWKEGRNPSDFFETDYYLFTNPDVKRLGINPLIHYIKHGINEGRITKSTHEKANINKTDKEKERIPIYNEDVLVSLSKKNFDEIFSNDNELILHNQSNNLNQDFDSNDINDLDVKVSVIIPTKNASDNFQHLLKMLTNQVGIKKIEIIVVDSGSKDKTIEIAKNYKAKIININPQEFSHSYARNLGAENASGDFFLFTVQDALPPSKSWLFTLLSYLLDNGLVATSCAELPRKNADLFYRIISWNHYEFLGVNKIDRIFTLPKSLDYSSLRKNGQLSDLACLISAEIFHKYKYQLNYAEDLDLGIRLIKDGHKLGFLGSSRIIHSHNRPPYYFLRRGYVDNLYLSNIFKDFHTPKATFSELCPDIIFSYNFLSQDLFEKFDDLRFPMRTEKLKILLISLLNSVSQKKYSKNINVSSNELFDIDFNKFLYQLQLIMNENNLNENDHRLLLTSIKSFLILSFKYLNQIHEEISNELASEIKTAIIKAFSLFTGTHLAQSYIGSSKYEKDLFLAIHNNLISDI